MFYVYLCNVVLSVPCSIVTTVDGQRPWTLGLCDDVNLICQLKIIQSRVGGRLVCSLPPYCVDVIKGTLRTVSVT